MPYKNISAQADRE
jgi:hypothetical protein